MDSKRIVRKILYNTFGGERPVGKSKRIWNDDVEEDPKILGIRNWKRYAIDRQAWRSCVQEAKARYQAVVPYTKNKDKKWLQRNARYLLPAEPRLALPQLPGTVF